MFKFSSTFLLHFIHKRSLNTISTSTLPSPSVSTIQFLTNSCGLSSGSLTSNGRKLRFDEKHIQQYEAIIGFFKSHGFENSQIANLVSRRPSILQSRVSTNLKPKFEFLQEIGHGKGKRKIGKAGGNCQQLEAPREWSLASARKASSKQDENRASER
ncbi:uncharacterized protein LOC116403869 isoform X2 [Cucumis sativus]|uniref:uncharacterized protein LOC116403869 isoform X2 n=1 Tax=Cucumis sativus TaxID=3659 RepID=UPI0012F4E323|nr:uncharacterized protein LOC116403869 isoform X2 [Cucumis sativus]